MKIKQAKLLDTLLSEFKWDQPLKEFQLAAVFKKVGLFDEKIESNFDFLIQTNMLRIAKDGGYEITAVGKLHMDSGGYTSQEWGTRLNKYCVLIAAIASVIAVVLAMK